MSYESIVKLESNYSFRLARTGAADPPRPLTETNRASATQRLRSVSDEVWDHALHYIPDIQAEATRLTDGVADICGGLPGSLEATICVHQRSSE